MEQIRKKLGLLKPKLSFAGFSSSSPTPASTRWKTSMLPKIPTSWHTSFSTGLEQEVFCHGTFLSLVCHFCGTYSHFLILYCLLVDPYWKYKFRNTTVEYNPDDLTGLQVQWASYLSIASMIPNVLFLFLNALIGHKFRSQPRLLAALIIIIVLFAFSTAMTKVKDCHDPVS